MTDGWRRVDQLLQAALLRPPDERDRFLRQACAGDTALENDVRSLLAADEQAGSFLEDPAIHAAARALAENQSGDAHRTDPREPARMALSPGSRLGPYEISAQIGAGGMGEVYRATDTNLARHVAIKVLPETVAADADRLARFDREAKTLAALNHPNIAAIYGLERSGGTIALVMELVEGLTLADRTAHGAIPVSEALPIARQIAEALEAAHEQAIIHRDLKPANIKVRPDGTVKVLDFGLAKLVDPVAAGLQTGPSVTQSPTVTTPAMTHAGMILGTAAYMSPEQAKGRPADRRSDVWAFGAILYEMLTGTRAFGGEDIADTLAFVLTREPEWTTLPAGTPTPIRRLLSRCLEKDRKRRLADAADARLDVEEALTSPSTADRALAQPGAASRSAWARALPWVFTGGLAAGLALVLVLWVPWSP